MKSLPKIVKIPAQLTRWQPAHRFVDKHNQGITLAELIVSSVVATIVLSISLGGAMFNRELYNQDQVRTRVSQNIRSVLDLVGSDIQQAGERIPRDRRFPVLELRQNGTSSSLIMRRHILDQPLTVCQSFVEGDSISSLQVFERFTNAPGQVRPPGTCAELRDETGNPLTTPPAIDTDLAQWQAEINSKNGRMRAYLYNGDGSGQFVQVIGINPMNPASDPTGNSRVIQIVRVPGQAVYTSGTARLYLLEERKYEIVNNTLQMTVDDGVPQALVSGIQRMQISVRYDDQPTPLTSFCAQSVFSPCVNTSTATEDAWSEVDDIKIEVTATDPASGNGLMDAKADIPSRTMSETFFPRNILNFN